VKLFATTAHDAAWFGKSFFELDGKPFFIIQADIPDIVNQAFEHPILDRRETVAISLQQLDEFNRVCVSTLLDYVPLDLHG
jgi:hypothetical protein